jgi:hypothetical protein
MRTPDLQLPPKLEQLVDKYAGCEQKSVEIHPTTWARKWPDHPAYTSRLTLTVSRDDLKAACAELDLDDRDQVLSAFVLVMAWGGGKSGRPIMNTQRALADPDAAHLMLKSSAEKVAGTAEQSVLESAHEEWSLPGVRQAFFSKWFAFAGVRESREWQPLILDARVYATLNKTLKVSTIRLADSHRRKHRYRAYVQALHLWAKELSVPAERLEWILFRHNGKPLP